MPVLISSVVLALLLGFGSAWRVQEWRFDSKEKTRAEQQLANERLQAAEITRLTKQVSNAQSAAAIRAVALRRDADGARTALVSLSDATEQALRNAQASHASCLVTAATERDVLNQCGERYRGLAETADRHASDVQTLISAWPK